MHVNNIPSSGLGPIVIVKVLIFIFPFTMSRYRFLLTMNILMKERLYDK